MTCLHRFHHGLGFRLIGRSRLAITHQLGADKQATPAYIANAIVALLQFAQSSHQEVADATCILLQLFVRNHIQHGQRDGAGYRIAAKGIEVLHAADKAGGNLRRGHHGAHRMTVADRLADGDDIRHDALRFERPEMFADPAKTDLHLIGQTRAPGRTHRRVGFMQVALRQHDLAAAAQE